MVVQVREGGRRQEKGRVRAAGQLRSKRNHLLGSPPSPASRRYHDAYHKQPSAPYVPPVLVNQGRTVSPRRDVYKCTPGYGSAYHCPEAVADDVDMNRDGVATMDLGDMNDLVANGLQLGVQAFAGGSPQGALLIWKRWINQLIGDASADKTALLRSRALDLGIALLNSAVLLLEDGPRFVSLHVHVPECECKFGCVRECSRRYSLVLRRAQSALSWAGLELTLAGFGKFDAMGVDWQRFVAFHSSVMTKLKYSWYNVEPPFLRGAPTR